MESEEDDDNGAIVAVPKMKKKKQDGDVVAVGNDIEAKRKEVESTVAPLLEQTAGCGAGAGCASGAPAQDCGAGARAAPESKYAGGVGEDDEPDIEQID